MNVACPECRSVFRVDPSRVPSSGVRARCSVCGGVITIGGGTSIDDEFATPATAVKAVRSAAVGGSGTAVATPPSAPPPATIRPPAAGMTPGRGLPPVRSPGAPPTPSSARPPIRPGATPPIARPTGTPGVAPRTPTPRPPGPLAPPRSLATPSPLIAPTPPVARPAVSAPPAAPPPPSAAAGSAPTPRLASALPTPASASGLPTPARAPINPFLANDPNAKARRLARALVSDLVTYFPQRRDEGVRNGTLRELFREEIKKSYEEYIDQIGKEFADSTTHFQDALNEILGGGQKLF